MRKASFLSVSLIVLLVALGAPARAGGKPSACVLPVAPETKESKDPVANIQTDPDPDPSPVSASLTRMALLQAQLLDEAALGREREAVRNGLAASDHAQQGGLRPEREGFLRLGLAASDHARGGDILAAGVNTKKERYRLRLLAASGRCRRNGEALAARAEAQAQEAFALRAEASLLRAEAAIGSLVTTCTIRILEWAVALKGHAAASGAVSPEVMEQLAEAVHRAELAAWASYAEAGRCHLELPIPARPAPGGEGLAMPGSGDRGLIHDVLKGSLKALAEALAGLSGTTLEQVGPGALAQDLPA
jgi:hypothetical protein